MARVYVGYDQFGITGVDDEFIRFIFDVVVSLAKLEPESEIGLVITNDVQMQKLNRQYRGKDQPTNVLSFAYHETVPSDFMAKGDEHYIGDIYISYERVLAQAEVLKVADKDEFARLFVHGVFHLAGIHHNNPKEEARMEALEDKALAIVSAA